MEDFYGDEQQEHEERQQHYTDMCQQSATFAEMTQGEQAAYHAGFAAAVQHRREQDRRANESIFNRCTRVPEPTQRLYTRAK